jgi:hypothetical protein
MDQTTGGPPAGHSFNSPVSFETLLRSGPCHCGQSVAEVAVPSAMTTAVTVKLVLMLHILNKMVEACCGAARTDVS